MKDKNFEGLQDRIINMSSTLSEIKERLSHTDSPNNGWVLSMIIKASGELSGINDHANMLKYYTEKGTNES